jgi:triosephosphate isomerase (TIM)
VSARKPYVGGNWKMNLNGQQARDLASKLADGFTAGDLVHATVFPPFPYLEIVGQALASKNSPIQLGAQNFYHQPNGAYTGEVSLDMLKDVGTSVVLIGHSERRHVLGETDTLINDKVLAALESGLEVILCIGEKIEQREADKTDAINTGQLGYGLAGVSDSQMANITIAYEPVWAIGTGKTATSQDAQNTHQTIRQALGFLYNDDTANAVRIQYGGSCKPSNAAELFAQTDIDGGLIGGAALKPQDFLAILQAAADNAPVPA